MAFTWSDLNPINWPGQVYSRVKKDLGGLTAESESAQAQRRALQDQATKAGGFADTTQENYGRLGRDAAVARKQLADVASGKTSLSAEQLRQALQQQLASQRSMAAAAAPGNAIAAARTAALAMGRAQSGLAGQTAMAGIAEREAARKALMDAILEQRRQELQAAQGSRQTAIGGYGGITPEKSWLDKWGGAITGAAGLGAKVFGGGGGGAPGGR